MNQLLKLLLDLLNQWFKKPADPIPAAVEGQAKKEALQTKSTALQLKRLECDHEGCFSELLDPDGRHICFVAEHAYDMGHGDGSYAPKLPNGSYIVKLGTHTLDHGGPQLLYCVQDVPGHDGICFHVGNWPQKDSDGCLLLGATLAESGSGKVVTRSDATLEAFTKLMAGVQEFNLVVLGPVSH